jgi:hypothetical protein
MTHLSTKEHEKMMKEMQREIDEIKRSRKAAMKYARKWGYITPSGRISRKLYPMMALMEKLKP